MTQFYIGQRVKKVRGEWNVGQLGVVHEIDMEDPSGRTLGVSLLTPGIGERSGQLCGCGVGTVVFGYPEDFEPILPPGLESPAEIAALFEPSPEVASVCPQ